MSLACSNAVFAVRLASGSSSGSSASPTTERRRPSRIYVITPINSMSPMPAMIHAITLPLPAGAASAIGENIASRSRPSQLKKASSHSHPASLTSASRKGARSKTLCNRSSASSGAALSGCANASIIAPNRSEATDRSGSVSARTSRSHAFSTAMRDPSGSCTCSVTMIRSATCSKPRRSLRCAAAKASLIQVV